MMMTVEEQLKEWEHNRILRVSRIYSASHPMSKKEYNAFMRWGMAGYSPYECAKVAFDPITKNELDYLSAVRILIWGDFSFLNHDISVKEAYELLDWKPELADRLHLSAFEDDMNKLHEMEW